MVTCADSQVRILQGLNVIGKYRGMCPFISFFLTIHDRLLVFLFWTTQILKQQEFIDYDNAYILKILVVKPQWTHSSSKFCILCFV